MAERLQFYNTLFKMQKLGCWLASQQTPPHFENSDYAISPSSVKLTPAEFQAMLTNWHTVLEIAGRTGAVYLLVLVGLRLTGKREVGQMTPFDLTLLLLLSNSVQNAMTGPDTSLLGGATAATVLLIVNFIVGRLSDKSKRFRKAVEGTPTILVHNGAIIQPHMTRECISIDELHRALREHGVDDINDVALAVLEVDGSISVLKYDDVPNRTRISKRLKFLRRH
jgi:uncharacterized membrane protein YcaP (DUF421 family)